MPHAALAAMQARPQTGHVPRLPQLHRRRQPRPFGVAPLCLIALTPAFPRCCAAACMRTTWLCLHGHICDMRGAPQAAPPRLDPAAPRAHRCEEAGWGAQPPAPPLLPAALHTGSAGGRCVCVPATRVPGLLGTSQVLARATLPCSSLRTPWRKNTRGAPLAPGMWSRAGHHSLPRAFSGESLQTWTGGQSSLGESHAGHPRSNEVLPIAIARWDNATIAGLDVS